jgi:rod shape-determining protein MreC
MISTSHNYHQTVLYGISRNITGFVAERIERGTYYFRLRQVNQELLEENTLLKKQIAELSSRVQEGFIPVRDSVSGANYTYLNTDFRLSASIARNDYFGSLTWDGTNYRYARLSEIPHHVAVSEGDTIVTSGFSAIFPAGLMAGTLTGEQWRGGDFVSLKVLLSADFKKLTDVYVIGNLTREERENLEKEVAQ